MAKAKRNWLVDSILFISFLLTFFLDLTGLAWHQWLGVGVGLFAVYHILIHWKWVCTITGRFFGRTSGQSRLYYLIDWSLFFSGALIGFSGLVISSWLNFDLANYLLWKNLHIYSSIAGLAISLIKIGTHWRWIVMTASRHFGIWRHPVRTPSAVPVHTSSSPGTMNRREFLQLMGVASIASLISASNLLEFGKEASQQIIAEQTSSELIPESAAESSSCTLLCNRGCTYPGECRRYIDQNNNGICDLSECTSTDSGVVSQANSSSASEEQVQESTVEEGTTYVSEDGCVTLCPSGCAYPGKCRDYVDNNSNGLCDLGECLVSNTTQVATTSGGGRHHRGGK